MVDIKKLTVTSDDERHQWITLLSRAGDYHGDMAAQFDPAILGDTKMEEVATVHRAWQKAIYDAVLIIEMWELKEGDDIKLPQHDAGPAG